MRKGEISRPANSSKPIVRETAVMLTRCLYICCLTLIGSTAWWCIPLYALINVNVSMWFTKTWLYARLQCCLHSACKGCLAGHLRPALALTGARQRRGISLPWSAVVRRGRWPWPSSATQITVITTSVVKHQTNTEPCREYHIYGV